MSTDEKIQKIQDLRAASPDDDDPRWEQLALGVLPDDERALLEADTSDEGRLLREIYRPMTPEEQARIIASAEERLDRRAAQEADGDEGDAGPVAPVVPLRPRWKARFGGASVFVAAAAAMALFYLRGREPTIDAAISQPLGAREDAVEQRLIAPDALFTTTIFQRTRVDGRIQIRGAALVRDKQAIPWDPHPNPTSPENRIRIVGTRSKLFPCLREGLWTVVVVVGLPGPSLSVAEVQRIAERRSPGPLSAVTQQIWLGAPVDTDGLRCRGPVR